ncbi:MAG TPA: bifunctional UDP-3-O-[3-hydroxymyristoyl] N-acetylglucosamine deacetylase/3-hydroxyacyl-ACP dehydratase [Saprospiraceae bacterium]|nr:bifunctional UDP-3-O-[3-hydroxymyristoyl] N-acetylglucosamine deacetylase/3-hydroxyacyl-ACP dehydratase [Saprospiraceae bacterium]MCB9328405.1 bifunctional UDP-3-O-[3-hydroxymyristoyl] N-acetylglucosamine deacetylase/3-hydroxyacyl-ACP dehydratase [Lewinellaceae bacterium]HPQ21330.1 bifunctional UDP-3-O-[3-hydroxymyristoyl] N-acetylglucosamine deacetylase/3-hydroxyacyl-ACP dehydratase [Saprospiraceae bacterium]
MKKKTLKDVVKFSGEGLHTGAFVNVEIHPADENFGIKFLRTDLTTDKFISVDVNHVVSTERCTTLESNGMTLNTTEHILASLCANGIDNALIKVDGPEIPILDGSAKPIVDLILKAGVIEQESDREYFELTEPIHFIDELTGAEYSAFPCDKLQVDTMIYFDSKHIGHQYASLNSLSDFNDQIAPCRTFVFSDDVEKLMGLGLIKGGDLKNAIVIASDGLDEASLKELSEKLGYHNVSINENGLVNSESLLFKNELARHKLLDIIGDVALLGKPLKARIFAKRPGHGANVKFTNLLKKKYLEQKKLKGKPVYNPDDEPIYDINGISKLLPHRYPFLLVDKIIELSKNLVVGIKNITMNENFFQGHFPENPIFPGVLQMEALAQTGGILALSNVEDPKEWDTFFLKMDNVKFKSKVVPGDTLILKMELLSPIRRGIVHMQGTAYVGNKVVSEGELTAQIIKKS